MVGDVVESPFPFTDLTSNKSRPILILSDVGMGDWIVCEMTSKQYHNRPRTISINGGDYSSGGLRKTSVVRYDRIHTLNQSIFGKTHGHLTNAKMATIRTAVQSLF